MCESRSWFFEKINKTDKPLARLIKKKRERIIINKIRSEKEVTTDTTEMQRIIRNYYEQLYDKKLPKLNQEEAESHNGPIRTSKIEVVIKKLLAHKSPELDSFTGKFYQMFKKERTPILLKLF